MTVPVNLPSGARRVDPDAEAARLIEERASHPGTWPVLCDEVHQVLHEGETLFVHVRVAVSKWKPPHADLSARIAGVIRERWPA